VRLRYGRAARKGMELLNSHWRRYEYWVFDPQREVDRGPEVGLRAAMVQSERSLQSFG